VGKSRVGWHEKSEWARKKRRVKVGEGTWKAQGVSYCDFSTSKYNNTTKIRVIMKSYIIIANMKVILYCLF